MEFLGSVFSDHPFFRAVITCPDDPDAKRIFGFPATNQDKELLRNKISKTPQRNKTKPQQQKHQRTSEIPKAQPIQKNLKQPETILPPLDPHLTQSKVSPETLREYSQALNPLPEVKPTEDASLHRSFFDIIYRGKVSALQSFLKRNQFDVNTLASTVNSKRYQGMCRTDGWAALHFCAWLNHSEMIRYLISVGADPNRRNMWQQAPIHVGSCRGKADAVQTLLKGGADVNLEIQRRQNQIAIHIACICGHSDVAEILISNGANVHQDNENGSGPTSSLQLAIQKGNIKVVEIILSTNPTFKRESGLRPLDLPLPNNDLFLTLTRFLDDNPAQIKGQETVNVKLLDRNISLLNSSKFLSLACHKTSLTQVVAYPELVRHFLTEKIDSASISAAFYQSCLQNSLESAQLLFEAGANINYRGWVFGDSGFIGIVKKGNEETIRFLIEKGASVHSYPTVLHVAVARGNLEIVKILAPKVNVNTVDENGQTPLHIAAGNDRGDIIHVLLDNNADINFPNTLRQGMTPLHVVAAAGRDEALRVLINRGANVNQTKTRKMGPQTALEMARESSYKTTETILLQAGAVDTKKARKKDLTSVGLLFFTDKVPPQFDYPKTCSLPTAIEAEMDHSISTQVAPNHVRTTGGPWQTIRLFISSTFTDMQSERDHLVKVTIPLLRQRAAQKRLHLVEVDLRWGVTEEEAKTGKTLEICLSEVDNCLIFAGLLGEKYGWVPTENQVRDDIKVRYDWVESLSVTDMEVKRAINNQKNAKCFTSFYFRDPESIMNVPAKYQNLFQDSKTNEISKLKNYVKALGQNITYYKTSYAGLGSDGQPEFSGLKEFGEKFFTNVWASIETAFPENQEEPSELEQEKFYHDQFIAHRTKNFSGRKDKLKELEKYANSTTASPYVVAGQAGSGKSALMAYFSQHLKESTSHFILPHFVGASPKSTDILHVLRRLSEELAQEFGLWENVQELQDYHSLIEKFHDILKQVSGSLRSSQRCVILLDAVNQLDDDRNKPSQMKWLPKTLPPGIRIIVSCLGGESLETLRSCSHPILEIGQLSARDRQDIVSTLLAQYNKRLDSRQMDILFSKKDVTEPLYLVVCCQELRVYGVYEKLETKITEIAPSLVGLLDQVLSRLEKEQGESIVRNALSFLQCSRHGLIELELVELLQVNSSAWASLSLSLDLFLRPMGREGKLDFFHRQIAKAVQRKYLSSPETVIKFHQKLADYYSLKCDPEQNFTFQMDSLTTLEQDPYPNALNDLCYHLVHSKQWEKLKDTLTSLYFTQRRAKIGQLFNLVSDFMMAEGCSEFASIAVPANVPEFKQFIQTHAPQLSSHPEGTIQLALNQTNSATVAQKGTLHSEKATAKHPLIKWENRPDCGNSSFLFLYMASLDVNYVAFSPNGKLIVSVQKDGSCSLWSTVTGEEITKYTNHSARSGCCQFSPTGKAFLSAGQDGNVHIYNTETKQLIAQLTHPVGANGSSWSPDEKQIAISLDDGSIVIYQHNANEYVKTFTLSKHSANVNCLSWSPDGTKLVSGSSDKTLLIWDMGTRNVLHTLTGHTKPVKGVQWAPSGKWILSCSQDKSLIVWSNTGQLLQTITGHKDNVESCAISPDENRIVSGSWDRTAVLWERNGAEFIKAGAFPATFHFVNAVAFSPCGKKVAIGFPDQSIKLYWTYNATITFNHNSSKFHEKIISELDYDESSQQILTSSWDKTLKLHRFNKSGGKGLKHYISTTTTYTCMLLYRNAGPSSLTNVEPPDLNQSSKTPSTLQKSQ